MLAEYEYYGFGFLGAITNADGEGVVGLARGVEGTFVGVASQGEVEMSVLKYG